MAFATLLLCYLPPVKYKINITRRLAFGREQMSQLAVVLHTVEHYVLQNTPVRKRSVITAHRGEGNVARNLLFAQPLQQCLPRCLFNFKRNLQRFEVGKLVIAYGKLLLAGLQTQSPAVISPQNVQQQIVNGAAPVSRNFFVVGLA